MASFADILVVDDKPENLELLVSMLEKHDFRIRPAINGEMALRAAFNSPPDLILLDISMPEMNGYEVCLALKENELTNDIPVLFVSAFDDPIDKVQAFAAGGVDYITKPFHLEEVLARIQTHLTLYHQRLEIKALREQERQHFLHVSQLKDQFVRTVSHDLKNPLSVINAYASLIKAKLSADADPKILDYVARVEDGVAKMTTLIHDLLDLSKIEEGEELILEDVRLGEFLQFQYWDFKISASQKHIKLTFVPPDEHLTVPINQVRMGQVISNLLSNAVKYTPEGGTIDLTAIAENANVVISVRDTGLGIPEEDLPLLFDKFHRVHSDEHLKQEGTGLGLAIVKGVVEQHQGEIWVESELGVGSTFFISLPLHGRSDSSR